MNYVGSDSAASVSAVASASWLIFHRVEREEKPT